MNQNFRKRYFHGEKQNGSPFAHEWCKTLLDMFVAVKTLLLALMAILVLKIMKFQVLRSMFAFSML